MKKLPDNLRIDGPVPILIAPGQYDATIINLDHRHCWDGRLRFWFRLATDPHTGQIMPGYATVQGNGLPAPGSKLVEWWLLIARFEGRARYDRIALRAFRQYFFKVQVVTAKPRPSKDEPIRTRHPYSVVLDIVSIVGKLK